MPPEGTEPEPSTGTEPVEPQPTDASAVSDVAAADDRPLRNVMAEWSRKFEQQSRLISDLASLITAQQQPAARAPMPYAEPSGATITDDQLLQAAQQGNVQAGLELNRRVSERVSAQQLGYYQRNQAVSQAIQTLAARHTAFNDPTSDLYNAAMRERHILVSAGAHPQSAETTLEAMKLAIVNAPHLAAGTQPATDNRARTSAVSSHNVPESSAGARRGGARPAATATDPRVAALAQRMGVKDVAGAMKRQGERNAAGKSAVTPMIATILREEG
jgi:hypothetical protein